MLQTVGFALILLPSGSYFISSVKRFMEMPTDGAKLLAGHRGNFLLCFEMQ
jgi:hypothetical protein